jgi:hypothetical protein
MLPFAALTMTLPLATVGAPGCAGTSVVHSGAHVGCPQPPRVNAASLPSVAVTNTKPFAIAGAVATGAPSDAVQSGAHVA